MNELNILDYPTINVTHKLVSFTVKSIRYLHYLPDSMVRETNRTRLVHMRIRRDSAGEKSL